MNPNKLTCVGRRPTDRELMPPPKKIKRPKNVIDEESYTQAISEIIARDFFPGLLESETKQEYLDALESKNKAWILSAQHRLEQLMTPGRRNGRRGTSLQSPILAPVLSKRTIDQIASSTYSSSAKNTGLATLSIDSNMSLDKFQSKYTSDDNESFYKLIDSQNQKRAEKYSWMWSENNKAPSKMMLKQKEVEMKLLQSRESLEDDGGKKDRLAIRDNSEKPLNSIKSKPNNGLMFIPEGIEDYVPCTARKVQDESRAGQKSVLYANTRMSNWSEATQEYSTMNPHSMSPSAVKDAISGTRRISESDNEIQGSQTPRVNGYAFLDDEPDDNSSPEIKLIDLEKEDLVKNPFTIRAQSSREDLLHRIVDKNAKKKRQSARYGFTGKIEQTPIPKFPSSPRVGSTQLTPAAQRLWSQVGLTPRNTPNTFRPNRSKPELQN